jgi:hypothetical protein
MAETRESLERRLDEERKNLRFIDLKIAQYTELGAPIHLLRQRDDTKARIAQIEEQLCHILPEPSPPEHVPPPPFSSRRVLPLALTLVAGFVLCLLAGGIGVGLYLWVLKPTPTPTPALMHITKVPTFTPLSSLTPSPPIPSSPTITPTPTPYYVEIVVDASARMSDAFEGGTTKMESAWQTAGTIGRTRAQKGQFVSIRTFGSGSEQTDMGCFESYSVFSFTNQDSDIKARLTTPPIPCGQAAVVTALTDASANLMAHENIGREIILLTGGDDECGSTLLTFYASENRSLWTQIYVVLFASDDFGAFIDLKAQGADINYSLVKNAAQAEEVAEEIGNPPTPTPMPSPSLPPPTPMTESEPQPAFTPKPPPPTPTRGPAMTTRTPTPAVTQSPAHTSTPTSTPTSTKTAVPPTNTPTAIQTPTHTSTPTNTPVPPTPEVTYDPGSRTITIHPGHAQAQTGRLCKGKMADVDRYAVFLRPAYLQGFGEPAGLLATVTHVYPEESINITLPDVEVGQYNDSEIDASGEPLNYSQCAFNAVQSMRNQLGLPSELGDFNSSARFDHGTITIQLSSKQVEFVSKEKPVKPGIFAASDQANLAGRASAFRQFYWVTAAVNDTAFSPGSNDGTSYRIAYDRVDGDHYSGWEIVLPETDVSNFSRLAFDIRGHSGGEIPNVWLTSPGSPENDIRNLVDIEEYVTVVNTDWQRVEIPLTDFHVTGSSQQTIDLTRIIRVQIVFEWDDMAGMIYVDGFAFEP